MPFYYTLHSQSWLGLKHYLSEFACLCQEVANKCVYLLKNRRVFLTAAPLMTIIAALCQNGCLS